MAERNGGSPIDLSKLATGALVVVTTATALVSGATGAAARFLRNSQLYVMLGISFSLVAILIALIASLIGDVPGKRFRPKPFLIVSSFLIFAVATALVVEAVTGSLAGSPRPRIFTAWITTDGQPALSVTVKMDGMENNQTLNVNVRSVQPSNGDGQSSQTVFSSQTGADASGNADVSFSAPLPSGYDALQVVANLGNVALTCDGKRELTPASSSPSPVASASAAVPTSSAAANTEDRVFSCVTATAPNPHASARPRNSPG